VLDARNRSDGYLHNATVTITWCFGHLLSMAAPEDYDPALKHWRAEHLPFIPPAWRLVIRPEVRKQFRIIEKLLKQADAVVIATDADREGETIAREILEQCRWRGPVQRLWLSALDDASIHKALAAMRSGDSTYPLYQAGLARARADWLVGMKMTRACTLM
ncbi:toprim domain-containing protein, partial [Klebsiella pneumoniae]|uniref:toprim domain-containing protein n=1 Tax=Klebsiella pneumoniae TaxID=573 RepID=UPI0021532770